MDVAVGNGIVIVAFDDFDVAIGSANHDAYMVRPFCAIGEGIFLFGTVIDDVTGEGSVAVIFFPASDLLKQTDLPLASTFGGNDVRETQLNGDGADECGAPVVIFLHQIPLGRGVWPL